MATRITMKQLNDVQSEDAAMAPYKRAQEQKMHQMDADAKLKELITGSQLKQSNDESMYDKQLGTAKALRQQYGADTAIDAGQIKIGGRDALKDLLMQKKLDAPSLTPAQESAEKAVGKQIADFDAAGGRPAMEKNLKALEEVQGQLVHKPGVDVPGARDAWDRRVGGLLSTSPALMGTFASAEKARRDKARNTAITIAKQTDPNPTEKQIETIMGQVYDPSSDDKTNEVRITNYLNEQRAKMQQMELASSRYHSTGYGTMGNAPAAHAPLHAATVTVMNKSGEKHIIKGATQQDLAEAAAEGFMPVGH